MTIVTRVGTGGGVFERGVLVLCLTCAGSASTSNFSVIGCSFGDGRKLVLAVVAVEVAVGATLFERFCAPLDDEEEGRDIFVVRALVSGCDVAVVAVAVTFGRIVFLSSIASRWRCNELDVCSMNARCAPGKTGADFFNGGTPCGSVRRRRMDEERRGDAPPRPSGRVPVPALPPFACWSSLVLRSSPSPLAVARIVIRVGEQNREDEYEDDEELERDDDDDEEEHVEHERERARGWSRDW